MKFKLNDWIMIIKQIKNTPVYEKRWKNYVFCEEDYKFRDQFIGKSGKVIHIDKFGDLDIVFYGIPSHIINFPLDVCIKVKSEKRPFTFKPFDRVLVNNYEINEMNEDDDIEKEIEWFPRFFAREFYGKNYVIFECTDGKEYLNCIPYKGNEHLLNS